MTIRVVQWTTGNVGKQAVQAVVARPDMELVGCFAWADDKLSAALLTPGLAAPPVLLSASETKFHTGWTIGGGLEYMFVPNWSAKVEYMYADFGSETYAAGLVPGGIGLSKKLHTIKGGINYHFDWGAGPLVARY